MVKGKSFRLLCQEDILKKGSMIQELKRGQYQNQETTINIEIIIKIKDTSRPVVGNFKRSNKALQRPEGTVEAKATKEEEVSEFVLSVSTSRSKDDWILNLRFTNHVTPNREFFSTYEAIDGGDVLWEMILCAMLSVLVLSRSRCMMVF